jgi:lysyl-tRNA synthetase class 1
MDHFENIKAWPFVEAKKLLEKIDKIEDNEPVVFETGYGPSGLPLMGSFGEVARTIMVKNAFEEITNNSKKYKINLFFR